MDKKMTYEQASKRLEEIVNKIESRNINIDTLTSHLKEAKTLAEFCKDKLTKVEQDVKKCLDM